MDIKPKFRLHEYNITEVIKVIDPKKQKIFIKNGMYPCDIYVNDNDELVMMFERKILA